MTVLSLSLLGPFQAALGEEPLDDFRTRKVQALLIYLVAEPEAHSRDSLLNLLWPGLPEKSARSNLRQILYYLRQAIPEATGADGDDVPVVIANRQEIRLNPQAEVTVDTWRLEALLDGVHAHDHLDLFLCPRCANDLEEAVALYCDHFLSDFYLDDSNQFEEWAQTRREYFRRRVLDALGILTTMAIRARDYGDAQAHAEKQLEIDNLRESAYRQLMEVLALSGRREQALAAYERCRRVLAEELGMAPSARTSEIYEKIVQGDLDFDTFRQQGVRGYELKEQIGEGAHGTIHRAIQPHIGREVAVKVIRRQHADDSDFIRRFEAEAQIVARLEHPYIVPLYDYWRDPHGAYLVMRYMPHGSLLSALKSGPWDPPRVASLLNQVADALSVAHQRGIVHRDIKPGNILLDEAGNAYLTDFGIAKDLRRQEPLTAENAVVGTLDYASPEQITNERVTSQSDIYSMGAVLYETLTGEKPFDDTSVAKLLYDHLNTPMPMVTATRPDVPVAIDTVLQKATGKKAAQRYATALEMAEAFTRAAGGLVLERPPEEAGPTFPVPEVAEIYNPYKGLRPFQEADADDFFGRDDLVQQLIDRLGARANGQENRFLDSHGTRFMAIVGPSGSGKSSAVKAGLIPALRSGALPGSENWFVTEMVPGTHPLEELELALWPVAVDPPPSLVEPMQRDTRGLLRTLRRILPDDDGSRSQLLLVIDQFEELFTLVEDEERWAFFLDSLLAALQAPRSPLRVLVTLRADFYDRPLQHQEWGRLLKENTEIVLPLNHSELTWAVREPARRMGVRLEEALVSAIVGDVADQPGSLPLLQYALTELFERRENGLITRDAYREIGGVQGALGRRAEALYEGLGDEGQDAARQLFLRLVTLGEGSEDTRRRVLRSEVTGLAGEGEAVDVVLERFGKARLLTFDRDPLSRAATVEVAHEALLREWSRLRRWLAEGRGDVRMQQRLAAAAAEWQQAERDRGFLLRGSRLEQFAGWADTTGLALTPGEHDFLEKSLAEREARLAEEEARRQRELETARQLADEQAQRAEEQSRAARRLRRLAAGLAFVLLLALALGWLANDQRATAQANFVEAERIRLASQAQNALDRGEGGELPALLALRSLALGYSPEADAALLTAVRHGFWRQQYLGHGDSVLQPLFSPDGRFLLTASQDGIIRLWQAQTGEEVRQYVGHTGPLWRLTISPDGRTILSAGIDGTARIWELKTGAELQRFTHDDVVAAVDFSPDGTHAVTSSGSVLYLWNLTSGAEVRRFEGHTDTVFTAVFSPDGSYLASAGQDNMVRLWEIESGAEVRQFTGHTDWIGEVDFSPRGRYLLTGSADRTARVWDVESGLELRRLVGHTDEVFSTQFSPDGRVIVTSSRDRTVRLWDTASGQERRQILGHTGAVFATFSPDGSLVATGSEDRIAHSWDVTSETEPEIILSPAVGHSVAQTAAAVSPDGQMVLTDQGDGTIRLWQTPASELVEQFPLQGDSANNMAFSPDGSLALAAGSDGAIYLLHPQSGQEAIRLAGHQGNVWAGTFSPDGSMVLTGGDDGTVRLWEVNSGREVRRFVGHSGPVRSVAFSPDGRQILTGGDDQMIFWQTESGEEVRRFAGKNGAVLAVAFAPDGESIVSGHDDQSAVLWDAATGRVLRRFTGHTDQVSHVAFSPDGQYVLTGSADQTARLWDVRTGRLLRQFVNHESPLLTVGFSEDGRQVYTADRGNAYAWRTALADVIRFACEQLSRDFTAEERAFYNIEDEDPTCPDGTEPLVRVEPTWTPTAPGAVDAAPLSLVLEREASGYSANRSLPEQQQTTIVNDISDVSNIRPIAGTRAYLLTDHQGATVQVYTSGLTPGHAVTLWWVVFNNPENCSDGMCGGDDAFPPPGNTAAGASVMYGTGQVIGDSDQIYFSAHLTVGENDGPWPVGLLNPRTAEIHFLLRDHGPAIPGLVYEQITTAGAGCNNFPPHTGDYTCVDIQGGVFRQQ